jgi:hypothetical protein
MVDPSFSGTSFCSAAFNYPTLPREIEVEGMKNFYYIFIVFCMMHH